TPESLYLLVTAERSRQMLLTVHTVIVDEIHAMARDKRGSHLSLTLERIETVAQLLVGDRPLPTIVDAGHLRDLDLALELPGGELEAVTSAEQMADVL